jgi:Uncharacterised protein family UPF0640
MASAPTLGGTLARVVPLGLVVGAALELFMVKVTVGSESFYQTALRLEAERRAATAADINAAEARVAAAAADPRTDPAALSAAHPAE